MIMPMMSEYIKSFGCVSFPRIMYTGKATKIQIKVSMKMWIKIELIKFKFDWVKMDNEIQIN